MFALLLGSACHLALPLHPADEPSTDGPSNDYTLDLSPDLATDAVTRDFPPLGCAGVKPTALFCEDFDGKWPPLYPLEHNSQGAAPERSAKQSHSGSYSMAAKTVGGSFGYSHGKFSFSPPFTTGEIAFRAYVNIQSDRIPSQGWIVTLQLSGADGQNKLSADLGAGLLPHVYCPGAGWEGTSTTALTEGKWHCVELRVSMANKTASLWLDEQLFHSCSTSNLAWPPNGFGYATFGVATDPQGATVLVDDVVIASGPIGCF